MERYNEPTPWGAASWDISFFDDSNKPIDESEATLFVIREYNEKGRILQTHTGVLL